MGMEFFQNIIPHLNSGFMVTVMLTIPSAIFGFLGGVFIGAVRAFAPRPLARIADAYVAVIRGVPLLLQLYFLYFSLPMLNITLTEYQAAIIGFILCGSAYNSEYIRGALCSIRQGQVKAAMALGFSRLEMVRTILVPQAIRRALPGCGNEVIYLIKYSSLAHLLTIMELTGEARTLAARSFDHLQIYLTAGLYYLFLTTLATCLLRFLEKKLAIPGFGPKSG